MARVKERGGVEIGSRSISCVAKTKIPFLVLSTETLVTQAMYRVAVYTSVKREKIR